MGPDGLATLVGLVNIGSGPLESDTLRIVLQVQIDH